MRVPFVFAASMLWSASSALAQAPFAPEPPGLWPGPMQGSTPQTLEGATVIDSAAMAEIVARQSPVLIDVANKEHQPDGRTPGLGWTPIHRSLPGATWMPGAGTGHDEPGFAQAFAARVAAATNGDKARPIVTFCHPQRWGSWNAAKRLTELGYTHVYWYPGGSEGWAAQGPTKALTEDPRWQASGFDGSSAGDMPSGMPASEPAAGH